MDWQRAKAFFSRRKYRDSDWSEGSWYRVELFDTTRTILIRPSYGGSVLLEIQERGGKFFIVKHRNEELTQQYSGKEISFTWIRKFMDHNEGSVKEGHGRLMKRKALESTDSKAWRREKKVIAPSKAKSEPKKRVYNLCKLCSGDGGIGGGCPKCGGTGWS